MGFVSCRVGVCCIFTQIDPVVIRQSLTNYPNHPFLISRRPDVRCFASLDWDDGGIIAFLYAAPKAGRIVKGLYKSTNTRGLHGVPGCIQDTQFSRVLDAKHLTSHTMPIQPQSATALRRLMTEYKQLTAGGSPDGMFTAGMGSLSLALHGSDASPSLANSSRSDLRR